jgi:hypothetical protein
LDDVTLWRALTRSGAGNRKRLINQILAGIYGEAETARLLKMLTLRGEPVRTYSGYHKFQTDSTVQFR